MESDLSQKLGAHKMQDAMPGEELWQGVEVLHYPKRPVT